MAQEIENEAGEKVTVYTADELESAKTEAATAAIATKDAEIAEIKRLKEEQGDNFKRYSQMTAEEKAAHDANTTNLLKREEALMTEIEGLKTTVTEKTKKESDAAKTNALKNIHNGDDKIKTELEKNYDLLSGMPEGSPEEINARAVAAARMAGITIDPRNPLYTAVDGAAPVYKQNAEYIDTPEGNAAAALVRDAMGIPAVK